MSRQSESESKAQGNLDSLLSMFDKEQYKTINEVISYDEYIRRCYNNPKLIRNAHQRVYDMIVSAGSEKIEEFRNVYTRYKFFDDAEIPVFGLYPTLDQLVKFLKGAAGGYGTERRMLLLHGPVGSSKSTILRRIKRGLEAYTRTDEGAVYTYRWKDLPKELYLESTDPSCMNEDPIRLLDLDMRTRLVKELNQVLVESTPESERSDLYTLSCEGELNPRCKLFKTSLLQKYDGDLGQVLRNHIEVVRLVFSEADRKCIGTFQPKDEKNQDATELTGDVNFRNIANYGKDSDPRAFNYDGEFNIANRGIIEYIEVLKLAKEFLYDLLGATQEHQVKPKKSPQVSIDQVIIGHTNDPEYQKLKSDVTMEALRDRTVKIDVPYLLKYSHELAVLKSGYGNGKIKQHIAPHTLEMAALWAVITRYKKDPSDGVANLVEKAKLYDGRALPGWNEDKVKELRMKHPNEGMGPEGVSARYVQDKIANTLSSHYNYICPFMVLNEIKEGLDKSSLITSQDHVQFYKDCMDEVIKEYNEILKNEVQKALISDKDAISRLCTNYISNIKASINNSKLQDTFTGKDKLPDEKLMRSIESKIGIAEAQAFDFRRQVIEFIGTASLEGKKFTWDSNPTLKKALEKKMYEDTRHTIRISAMHKDAISAMDEETQKKIDIVKQRLISDFGYNEESATDVLDYVSSLYSTGDPEEEQ